MQSVPEIKSSPGLVRKGSKGVNGSPRSDSNGMLQAAGHAGTLLEDVEEAGFILKPYDEAEAHNYENIWSSDGEPLQKFVARWGGKVDMQVGTADTSQPFMRLGNLLAAFTKPCVMDCKMGLRTFQEKEGKSTKARPDLYKRMQELRPELLNQEDHKAGSITKFQWMTRWDSVSTSKSLGFRVDGIVSEQGARIQKKELTALETRNDVQPVLALVLPLSFSEKDQEGVLTQRIRLVRQIIEQLDGLCDCMQSSAFFKSHEFVGASLLFVVDASQAHVRFIDFAKTECLAPGVVITHRGKWEMGNHEDGLLTGVESLIDCWRTTLVWLEDKLEGRVRHTNFAKMGLEVCLGESDMINLAENLHKYGVDTSSWGIAGTKGIEELYSEIKEERAVRFEVAADGTLYRIMDVVKAWLLVDVREGETVTLLEPKKRKKTDKDTAWTEGKRVEGKPVQKKVSVDQQWREALVQCMTERLGVSPESQDSKLEWQWNTYSIRTDVRLGTSTNGYAGLWSKYRVHEIDIRIKDAFDPILKQMGLPFGDDFTTMETEGQHSAFGCRQHFWKWLPIREAGYVARESEKGGPNSDLIADSKAELSDPTAKMVSISSLLGKAQTKGDLRNAAVDDVTAWRLPPLLPEACSGYGYNVDPDPGGHVFVIGEGKPPLCCSCFVRAPPLHEYEDESGAVASRTRSRCC